MGTWPAMIMSGLHPAVQAVKKVPERIPQIATRGHAPCPWEGGRFSDRAFTELATPDALPCRHYTPPPHQVRLRRVCILGGVGQARLQFLVLRQQLLHLRSQGGILSFQSGDAFLRCWHTALLHLPHKPRRSLPRRHAQRRWAFASHSGIPAEAAVLLISPVT